MYRVGLAGDSGEAWADLLLRTEVVWVCSAVNPGIKNQCIVLASQGTLGRRGLICCCCALRSFGFAVL